MKCLVSFAVISVSALGHSQIFTYDRLDHMAHPVVAGKNFAAISSLNNGKSADTFLHSIQPDGSIAWTVSLARLLPGTGYRIAGGSKHGVILSGFNPKSKLVSVARVSPKGKLMWTRGFPLASSKWALRKCVAEPDGSSLIYHGSEPTVTRLSASGRPLWNFQLRAGQELYSMVPLGDRTVIAVRTDDVTRTIEIDAKGKVSEERVPTSGFLIANRGPKGFFQTLLNRSAIFECFDLRTGKRLWSTTGPRANTMQAVVGPNDDLAIRWSNNSTHSIAHFGPSGELDWVKNLSSQIRLDSIRVIGGGRLQALTTPYDSSKVVTTLHTFARSGMEVASTTAPLRSFGESDQLVELNESLYVFSLFGEFNPGETPATGLIAKVWRLGR